MLLQFDNGSGSRQLDMNTYFDLTLAINKTGNVNCYYLEDPKFSYFESPEFSGNLSAGGSVNCEKISLYPHASGTHTECALHVMPVDFDMRHVRIPVLQMCRLITVTPEKINGDDVITVACLHAGAERNLCEAIVVRTLPNSAEKRHRNYSGTNPPFFDPEALAYLRKLGYKHILTDLPSIDRESDEGRLAAHKQWFVENGTAAPDRTITELIFVDDDIKDGLYVLNMQVPKMQTDAVPSKIWIFPCS